VAVAAQKRNWGKYLVTEEKRSSLHQNLGWQ